MGPPWPFNENRTPLTQSELARAERRRSACQAINLAEGLTVMSERLDVPRRTAEAWCVGLLTPSDEKWPQIEAWARQLNWEG